MRGVGGESVRIAVHGGRPGGARSWLGVAGKVVGAQPEKHVVEALGGRGQQEPQGTHSGFAEKLRLSVESDTWKGLTASISRLGLRLSSEI